MEKIIITTGFFKVNFAYMCVCSLHARILLAASSSCLVKPSRLQVMIVYRHYGQESSVLKTDHSSEDILCFISWCKFLPSPAALLITLYYGSLTCWVTLAKLFNFTVLILHYKAETKIPASFSKHFEFYAAMFFKCYRCYSSFIKAMQYSWCYNR